MTCKLWLLLCLIPSSYAMFGIIDEFNIKNGTWPTYVTRFEMFFKVNNITDDLKLPALITLVGDKTYELLENLAAPDIPMKLTYDKVTELLEHHLKPTPSTRKGRYQFRARIQQKNENILQYVAELQKLSRYCRFGIELGENLLDQFIMGLKNEDIRRLLFDEGDELRFVEAVKIAADVELSLSGEKQKNEFDTTTDAGLNSVEEEESTTSFELAPIKMVQSTFEPWGGCYGDNPVASSIYHLPNGMRRGRVMRVRGSTPPGTDNFRINLQCGPSTERKDDTAFHLKVTTNCVIYNKLNAGSTDDGFRCPSWGEEERYTPSTMNDGEDFEILILCEKDSFKTVVNGMRYPDFLHRIPYETITHFGFEGPVTVYSVTIKDHVTEDQLPPVDISFRRTGLNGKLLSLN